MSSKKYYKLNFIAIVGISFVAYNFVYSYQIEVGKGEREFGAAIRKDFADDAFHKCNLSEAREPWTQPEYLEISQSCAGLMSIFECPEKLIEVKEENSKDYKSYRESVSIGIISPGDFWGRHYWISCKKDDIALCSKGEDGVPNTEDDMIVLCKKKWDKY